MKLFLYTTCCFTLLLIIGLSVEHALAQTTAADFTYQPIVGLPVPQGFDAGDDGLSTGEFIKILYALSIAIAAMLAVVKIIYGGVQYMLTDVVTSKQSAKDDIKGALFGLLIVISAVLLLQTINPRLLNLKLFEEMPSIPAPNTSSSALQRADDGAVNSSGGVNTSSGSAVPTDDLQAVSQ